MTHWHAHLEKTREGALWVYSEPKAGRRYVVGADTAEGIVRDRGTANKLWRPGVDETPDFSAIIVVDLETAEHVATWKGLIEPNEFAEIVAAVGFYYNSALLVPEVNPPGNEVVRIIYRKIKYKRLYQNRLNMPHMVDDHTMSWGWRTTKTSRPALIERIREWLADNPNTRCELLLNELRSMVVDESGVVRAKRPYHDDLAMAFGMALQGRHEHYHPIQVDTRPDGLEHLPPNDRAIHEALEAKRAIYDRNRRATAHALRRDLIRGSRGRFVRGGVRKRPPKSGGDQGLPIF